MYWNSYRSMQITAKTKLADLPSVFEIKHTKYQILLLDFAHCANFRYLDGIYNIMVENIIW